MKLLYVVTQIYSIYKKLVFLDIFVEIMIQKAGFFDEYSDESMNIEQCLFKQNLSF